MQHDRFIGLACIGIIAGSLAAQTVPICCRILYDWPPDGQGPEGACSGSSAVVCESSVQGASPGDDPPIYFRAPHATRPAQCCDVDVGSGYFVRAPCDGPPQPGAEYVAQLPDGTCCWGVNPFGDVDFFCVDQSFRIAKCEGPCEGGGGPQ